MSALVQAPAELQADALIDEIARRVARDRRDLLDAAAREADQVRQRARIKARRQMRRAVAEMRASEAQRLLQVRAELEAERRRHEATRALGALAAAWPRLGEAIERRWNDPAARARWIDAQVVLALARFGRRSWTVRHPAVWSPSDMAALRSALDAHGAAASALQADPQLRVGLVIESDRAMLDSTPAALLADRRSVEAELLARLPAAAAGGSAQ